MDKTTQETTENTQETTTTQETKPEETTSTETTEETVETEEDTEETTETSDDLDEESLKAAKALYRSLKDPNSAIAVVTEMARQLGITGTSTKEATKTILDHVAESLGKEYAFLAPKLVPAIKNVVSEEISSIRKDFEQLQLKQAEAEVDEALAALNRSTKGEAKKFFPQMAKLLDEMPPSGKIPIRKHLTRLYNIAKQDTDRQIAKSERMKKASDNAGNIGERVAASGRTGETRETQGKVSLDKALEMAMQKIEKG